MKALEEKILKYGKVYAGNVLKVDSFLNHQLDVDFLMEMGREIQRLFNTSHITKIVTIESSGIAIAMAAAASLHVPVVYAKKNRTSNLSPDTYTAKVHSYTHSVDYDAVISKEYLNPEDNVLIVDDFLACGSALNGLLSIIEQAGASLAGVAIAIEKGFQHGGDMLREKGIKLESLAIIESMNDNKIVYRR